ncbi:MAG: LPS ABC transporter substrate-binding protein LptA [Xanthobacteraceae bacterium]|nr:LPS ABC transporter substrate-binding protein LptA [Xanthobacteraceae bacterium]
MRLQRLGAIMICLIFGIATAHAQTSTMTGVPNAMQGFSQNRDKPIQIDAMSLEMRDKDKAATFAGNVKVVQGDTTMRAQKMIVYYDEDPNSPKPAMKSAKPGPGGSSSIRRLEAIGGVTVTQKDQTVSGSTGIFDMRANTVTMQGDVILTKDKNVLRGDKLIVDMTTGVSRVESNGGRGVSGIFQQSKGAGEGPSSIIPNGASGGVARQVPQSQSAPAAGKPLKLNSLQQSSPPRG